MKENRDFLSDRQQYILAKFVETFLPKRGNKRKNAGNELEVVQRVLCRIFNKYFGFTLSFGDVFEVFKNLNYNIYDRKGEWDWNKKVLKPSINGDSSKSLSVGKERVDIYERYNTGFIYFDIDAYKVRDLARVCVSLPPKTSNEKIAERQRLIEEIERLSCENNSAEVSTKNCK